MNLAIRGVDGRIEQGGSFLNDRFPDLEADYILADPPFNMRSGGGERLRETSAGSTASRPRAPPASPGSRT